MKLSTIILVLWTLCLLSILLVPFSEEEIPSLFRFTYFDKVANFALFFITGLVIFLGTKFINRFRIRMLYGIAFGLFLAVGIELAQFHIPLHRSDLYDLIVRAIGLGVALLLCYLLYRQAGLRTFFRL